MPVNGILMKNGALSVVMSARAQFWKEYGKRHEIPFQLEI
jgi:hypothetical protein